MTVISRINYFFLRFVLRLTPDFWPFYCWLLIPIETFWMVVVSQKNGILKTKYTGYSPNYLNKCFNSTLATEGNKHTEPLQLPPSRESHKKPRFREQNFPPFIASANARRSARDLGFTNVRQLASKAVSPGRFASSLWTIRPQSLDD